MGVSAVFVSCMAVRQLPEPQNPPTSQQDILAMALAPVIGFSVFVSILVRKSLFVEKNQIFFFHLPIDGLSIPLFLAGRRILCHVQSLDAQVKESTTRDSLRTSEV